VVPQTSIEEHLLVLAGKQLSVTFLPALSPFAKRPSAKGSGQGKRITRIGREAKFCAAKSFASRIKVKADMRSHRMNIPPVALHRLRVVVGTSATIHVQPLDRLDTEASYGGILQSGPIIAVSGERPSCPNHIKRLAKQGLRRRDIHRYLSEPDLLVREGGNQFVAHPGILASAGVPPGLICAQCRTQKRRGYKDRKHRKQWQIVEWSRVEDSPRSLFIYLFLSRRL
jgi:hypothetical protein